MYSIFQSQIEKQQEASIDNLKKLKTLSEELSSNVQATISAQRKTSADQEKLNADVGAASSLVAEGRSQFQLARTQFSDSQQQNAEVIRQVVEALKQQSEVIGRLLKDKTLQASIGESEANAQGQKLTATINLGEDTVKKIDLIAANARFTVFVHLSKAAVMDANIEYAVRTWLASQGYVVGGITRDSNAKIRHIDYFYKSDADAAKRIADGLKEKFRDVIPDLEPKEELDVRNPRGYLGLWL